VGTITTKQLHHDTSAVLDHVQRGRSFEITRNGKVVGRIVPTARSTAASWYDVMGEVWEAQRKRRASVPNPVIAERQRRRR